MLTSSTNSALLEIEFTFRHLNPEESQELVFYFEFVRPASDDKLSQHSTGRLAAAAVKKEAFKYTLSSERIDWSSKFTSKMDILWASYITLCSP